MRSRHPGESWDTLEGSIRLRKHAQLQQLVEGDRQGTELPAHQERP
ncbi:hypothetical protein RMR21_026390 (plasmid) [Agrobacterium sp. rho-8.1]|nr:hypothetical protein [Agrobacterium sp. rho-8.1]